MSVKDNDLWVAVCRREETEIAVTFLEQHLAFTNLPFASELPQSIDL